MAIEWLIPAAKEAYNNRNAAMTAWDRLVSTVLGPKYRIAFVGPGGIGKTVLLDHVSGKAFKKGYSAPGTSRKAEAGKAKVNGSRLAVVVAPGQKSGPQLETYNDIFNPESPVDGIVFVVASGLVTLREEKAKTAMIARGIDTVEKWRDQNMAVEIEYLKELCGFIRSTKKKARKPKWVIVAITKSDLLYDSIVDIRNYYAPHSDSVFARTLNELRDGVGHDNLEWEAVPVCSSLDDFSWSEQTLESKLGEPERDHLLAQFVREIEGFCQ